MYLTVQERKNAIKKINDIRFGKGFQYYKEKFYMDKYSPEITEEEQQKLYIDYKVMNKVLKILISFCPMLEPKKYDVSKNKKKNIKKNELIKLALAENDWANLSNQIYETLETKGDCFFYVYFDDNKKVNGFNIPRLKMLKSEDMEFVEFDDFNQPITYVYNTQVLKQKVDLSTGFIYNSENKNIKTIFRRGEVIKIEDFKPKENGIVPVNRNGNEVLLSTIPNKDFYSDIIPIVHISADRVQDEQFSVIPADEYVNICLHIDQITSDIRSINRQLGFPRIFLIDCEIAKASGRIGGMYAVKTVSKDLDNEEGIDFSNNQGKVQDIQLKNSQETNFRELATAMDNLHDIAGITNPTLMSKLGSSDSSKVFQQINARMENKIEGYMDNITKAFKNYFKILLLANDLYDEKVDANMSFEKSKVIIKPSEYDRLINQKIRFNIGEETLREHLVKQGKTVQEIDAHIEDLNKEILANNVDVAVKQTVAKEK